MKNLFACLLLLMICVPAFAQEKLGIAAIVNNEVITNADVEGRYNMAVHGANMQPDTAEQKSLHHQALDSLIDEQIRLQEASKLGITPTDDEVNAAFAKLAEQNNATPDQFTAALKETPGIYESIRHQIKTQLAWSNVIKKKIRPQVNVGENDINAYIAEKEKNPAKVEYQVAEIFLKNNDNNQKLAMQLVSEMRSGKAPRFSVVARQFSEGMEASKGGLLGWVPENQLEPEMNQAVKNLKPGEVSDPFTSPRGIHVLMLLEKRDVLPVKESILSIGLKQIVLPLPSNIPPEDEEKAMAQVRFFQTQAKDCAGMDDVIKKLNLPTAKDMGMVKMSSLPSGVVDTVKDLPIGKISPIIRSKDSVALYMVCNREQGGDDAVRDDVANIIGTERLTRMQYRYYRDLRASAYVDIK
jgi:peptidyl-prolyl cis-trans isomerase SurA